MDDLSQAVLDERWELVTDLFGGHRMRSPFVAWNPERLALRSAILRDMHDAWQMLGGDVPVFETIDWRVFDALRHDMLIVEPVEGGQDFVYAAYGERVGRSYGEDRTGQRASDLPAPVADFFIAVYQAAMVRREPVYSEHEPPPCVLVNLWSRLILPTRRANGAVGPFIVGIVADDPLRLVMRDMPDATIVYGDDGRIVHLNPAAQTLLALEDNDARGRSVFDLFEDRGAREAMAAQAGPADLRLHGTEGPSRHVEVSVGETLHRGRRLSLAVLRDVSVRRENERRMRELAYTDALTGIGNRAMFDEALRDMIGAARRKERRLGLLLVDLDDLKLINDRHGHSAGDEALRAIARRLTDLTRRTDVLARIGGDEFALIQCDLPDARQIIAIAERLKTSLARALVLKSGAEITVTASIGVAVFPDHARTTEALFERADRTLYEVKARGKNDIGIAS